MAARKLPIVLVLLLVVSVGLTAARVGLAPAGAATGGDSVVLAWNQQVLDSIAATKTGPTIAARALAVVHTAIYDAWAAYDAIAVPTMANGNGRQPPAERTLANKNKAVSFAAYLALVDQYPARQGSFADKMTSLHGADFALDTTVPATVGTKAAQAVLGYRHGDGANQLGDEPGATPGVAYSDYTGYTPTPRNTWDKVGDPDRWQPLCVPTPPPGATQLHRQDPDLPDSVLGEGQTLRAHQAIAVPPARLSTPVESLTVGAGGMLDTYEVSVAVAASFLRPLSR